jgi:hypothetical protein
MIKHKKYTHTKGGKINQFENFTLSKNKQTASFILKLQDNTEQTFKITQHTFAHFDEFTNKELHKQINKFNDILQFFVLFIFLLNSMKITKDELRNITYCNLVNTCKITKKNDFLKNKLTLYIASSVQPINLNNIFITSLFENSSVRNNINTVKKIDSIKFSNSNSIHFSLDIINQLLYKKDEIINNNYNVDYIKEILFPNTKSKSSGVSTSPTTPTPQIKTLKTQELQATSPTTPTPQIKTLKNQELQATSPTTPTPQIKTLKNQELQATYQFSIPKNSGGKKNKTYKNHKYKKHKHKKEKEHKDKGRKTRKK